jgi:hypothetical protein
MSFNQSDPFLANLIGFWDFLDSGQTDDTGLADSIAQNGQLEGDAFVSNGVLNTDGCGYFTVEGDGVVPGNDAPFDLGAGTIALQFTQDQHAGTAPDTLVTRGEYCDRATEGFFEIRVTKDGRVEAMHCSNGADLTLRTPPGFFNPGDTVKVTYTWSDTQGGTFLVENLTSAATETIDHTTTGLTMDIGDNDAESFAFGAREVSENSFDRFFEGNIDYVAVYNTDIINSDPPVEKDGVITGTEGDDLIDLAYTGDPEGDRVDANDAVLPGQAPNDDIIFARGGNDTVFAGKADDTVFAGSGDDYVDGQGGNDTLFGEVGNDTIFGGRGDDTLDGGDGDDTLSGGDGFDTIEGGAGNDIIEGNDGVDIISGGAGNDTITGGANQDVLFGGDDRDTFLGATTGDIVDGGEGTSSGDAADDYDILDLTGAGEANNPGGSVAVDYDANPENGTVRFLNSSGIQTGTMTFKNIEKVIEDVICFTPGTLIATPKGEKRVETLKQGDRIITRDNGIQEIQWLGQRGVLGTELDRKPHLRPVRIKAGALGNGLPEHDMMVSPNHRILVASDKTALYFEEREVLVAAKYLIGLRGVEIAEVKSTTYFHLLFAQHEVILSNGAWTESFQPGDYSLQGIGNAQRAEIMELFPELSTPEGLDNYMSARRSLKKHEARILTK